MSPIKHNADSMQNSSNFPSQPKGKKRSRSDQTSESKKKENSVKHNGGDSVQLRSDHLLKSEISKLAAKGLVDSDSVDKLVQLMQPEKSHRKMDLSSRSMLAGILAASERLDCLNLFVQRRGLAILDEWLKEVQKGKVGTTAKDGDKQVEDFLLVLLNALDKLPVNLNALQTCNIGKSVNHLRSQKSVEVHKKAKSLVDTWKQRVEAEMNNNDAKSSSSPEVPVPARSKNEISYDWKKHSSASSEAVTKTSGQLSSPKSAASSGVDKSSSGIDKSSSPPGSVNANLKQGQLKTSAVGPTTVREEKSSTSSQSHTNSQYSSELARKSGKEDANSSTAGSRSMNRTRQRKSINGLQVTIPSGAEKESGTGKHSTMLRSSASEKVSNSTITCENASTPVAKNNKMIIKIHNRGCSPGKSSTAGASTPALSQKCDKADAVLKKKSAKYHSVKADHMPDALPEQCGTDNDNATLPDAPEGLSIVQKDSEANTSTATADNPSGNFEGKKQSNGVGPSYTELLEMALIRKGTVGDTKEIHMKATRLKDEEDLATDGMGLSSCSTFKELLDMALIRKGTVGDTKEKTARLKDEEDSAIDGMGPSSCNTFKELLEMPLIRKDTVGDTKEIHMKAASLKDEEDSATDAVVRGTDSLKAEQVVKEKTPSEDEEIGDSSLPSVSTKADPDVLAESAAKLMATDTSEVDASDLVEAKMKQRDENDVSSDPGNEESFAISGDKIDCKDGVLENLGASPAKEISSCGELERQMSSVDEKKDKHSSATAVSSLSASGVPDNDKKLEFDLNEGFDMDEMKSGELIDFAASSLPTSSLSLGWKGLAATSAFHPAESRKLIEVSDSLNKATPHNQARPLLEIDLNVTDERVLQDITIQNSGTKVKHKPDDRLNSSVSHYSGGFQLDLNRVDEDSELAQYSAGNNCLQIHSFPISRAASVDTTTRGFDLNNGPALDERPYEPLSLLQANSNNNTHQPHFGLRMNRPILSSKSSWDSPGTTYSAVTIATPLPDSRDHPFPIMAAGPQRILSGLTSTSFNPEFYRGPALSSSPLHYPAFPFGTSFPLPTSGTAAYMDPSSYSSAPRFYAPAIPAQFMGSAAAIPSQYLHPRMVGIPDVGGNGVGQSSQNFVRQGLDLNSGPGTSVTSLDIEARDRMLNMSTRQFSAVNPQGLPGEQARSYHNLAKRKEPDGGWDAADGNSFKQSSWR